MKLIVCLIAAFTLLGCAPKYGCSQFPETGCKPVSMVYDDVENGVEDYRYENAEKENKGRGRRSNYGWDDHNNYGPAIHINEHKKAINTISAGDVTLSQPVVMRVLIAPWIDEDKNYNDQQYVYLRLKESQWILAE